MNEVINYLKNKLSYNDTIIVACSGGPDSMCLLDILVNLKEEYNLTIVCAHVNHKHRSISDYEEEKVKEYCLNNNILFELHTILKYKNNKFTESESRDIRYNFFEELKNKYNAKYIMTAHHGDDLIETILMRITRGSNLKGYIGLKKENNYYIRPLLTVTKEDILEYINNKNMWYATDESNNSLVHTRNRFRINILPFLKKEDKNIHKKFLKYSEELISYDEYINKYILSIKNNIINNNIIDISKLLKEDKFIVKKFIENYIEDIQVYDKLYINDKNIKDILDLLYSNKSNLLINLNNGYIAIKSYNTFIIKKKIQYNKYNIVFNNSLIIPCYGKISKIDKCNSNSNYILRLDSKDIKLPIIVRNKMDGDYIEVKNMLGKKKVKDIFIDEKINKEIRSSYPIVCDSNNNILWVPGIKKSKFDKDICELCDIILKYEEENNETK